MDLCGQLKSKQVSMLSTVIDKLNEFHLEGFKFNHTILEILVWQKIMIGCKYQLRV